ncbi:MAG: phosphoadenosine phosphosulfate reductase family protein [Phycisphaerae bacterium]|jgi:3'-phosphoadenosine 5'-phosphosulfate sulfotransferase (PAPS reductase)/FAD synthetase
MSTAKQPARHSSEVLRQYQSLPLTAKVKMAQDRIRGWYERWDGQVYAAFSGGKDSTVLLHLVRSMYPEVPAVFHNTGLEFPELCSFVKLFDNVVWSRPEKTFRRVIEEDGYPIVSKRIADEISKIRRLGPESKTGRYHLTGYTSAGKFQEMAILPQKWQKLLDAPFLISPKCCDRLKKAPSHAYEQHSSRKAYTGEMAEDSTQRKAVWQQYGCNQIGGHSVSRPMSAWLETDVWEYIRAHGLPVASVYDMGYRRTGCMFCMFGVHLEQYPNRFQLMASTHPKQWAYCMKPWEAGGLGLRRVLDYIGVSPDPIPETRPVRYAIDGLTGRRVIL